MIVVGVDAHRQTHTAAVVSAQTAVELDVLTWRRDRPGMRSCSNGPGLSARTGFGRLRTAEPCPRGARAPPAARRRTGPAIPPKLMAKVRDSARTFGKSDSIDAVAVARAAIREPRRRSAGLPGPEREIRLLIDHRENLVQDLTRYQRRLREHLHEIDPTCNHRCGPSPSARRLDRLARQLTARRQDAQVRIARELIGRIRELVRHTKELKTQLARLVSSCARRCSSFPDADR